ncbi:MAG: ABC transporter substrate-binding protein [Gaiellaceae bacterium]
MSGRHFTKQRTQQLHARHPLSARRTAATFALALLACLALVATASSQTSRQTQRTGGTAVIAEVGPFSGPDASLGASWQAGCKAATYLVDKAGGADGTQLHCITVDTVGDPADGVAAVRKTLATTSNLAGVLGPDGGTADTIVPIFNAAHVTMAATNGGVEFNKNTRPYYWRYVPSDSILGTAMALAAHDLHYRRAAAIFTTDQASQTQVPDLIASFKKLGGTLTSNQAIAPNQPNYRTEIAKLLASHPQVIFTETDPATAATLWSNLKQLETKPIPIVGTATDLLPTYVKAVDSAVGKAYVRGVFYGVNFYTPPLAENPSMAVYQRAVLAKGAGIASPKGELGDPYAAAFYDGATVMALAMETSHSVSPKVYNSYIAKIVNGSGKKTVKVHGFAQGQADLRKGLSIQYVPTSGPISFDRYHNTLAPFVIERFGAGSGYVNGRVLTVPEVKAAAP